MTTIRKDVQELFERAAKQAQQEMDQGCQEFINGMKHMLAIVVQREGEPFHESFMRVDGMLHRMMQPSVLDELPIVLDPGEDQVWVCVKHGVDNCGCPGYGRTTGYDTGKPLYDDPI